MSAWLILTTMNNRELLADMLGAKSMNVLARTTVTNPVFAMESGSLEIVPFKNVVHKHIIKDGEWDNTLVNLVAIQEDLAWLLTQPDDFIDHFFTEQNICAEPPQSNGEIK